MNWDLKVKSFVKKLLLILCSLILVSGCGKEKLSFEEIKDEKKTIMDAIVEFYGNTSEPIIIYEQTPFKEGTLVLAEMLTEGEHYPELYFVDGNNKVTYRTRGSYCWTLNYTQFKGHYIYFGLAGVETRQNIENPVSVERIEALFADKTVSALPSKKVVKHTNSLKEDNGGFKTPQGYIMPVEGRNMPKDFICVLTNGEKKSISKMIIEHDTNHMPDYLKSNKEDIYNSFAFTFTPMLTPTEWDEGEICLGGEIDKNNNRNALHLCPVGHMSFMDSYIVPQDIKPLYLSDNSARIGRFSSCETVMVNYSKNRKMLDCRILKLTRENVEKEIGQDSFVVTSTDKKGQLVLPKDKGYYLFLLRTNENSIIQTYTGMFIIS